MAWCSVKIKKKHKYNFIFTSMEMGLGIGCFIHKRIISAVNIVEFISDRLLYMIHRGHWCDIIVLNVHASTGDKSDDTKNRFLPSTRACIEWVSEIPHENSVRGF